jgi:hypothetical protein
MEFNGQSIFHSYNFSKLRTWPSSACLLGDEMPGLRMSCMFFFLSSPSSRVGPSCPDALVSGRAQ